MGGRRHGIVGHSLIWVLAKERRWVVALSFRCCLCLSEVDWEGGVGILMNIQKYTTTNDEFHPSFVVWLPCRCQRCGTWVLYERCELLTLASCRLCLFVGAGIVRVHFGAFVVIWAGVFFICGQSWVVVGGLASFQCPSAHTTRLLFWVNHGMWEACGMSAKG